MFRFFYNMKSQDDRTHTLVNQALETYNLYQSGIRDLHLYQSGRMVQSLET